MRNAFLCGGCKTPREGAGGLRNAEGRWAEGGEQKNYSAIRIPQSALTLFISVFRGGEIPVRFRRYKFGEGGKCVWLG